MRLTADQTEVLQASIAVIDATGMNTKPITVPSESMLSMLDRMPNSYRTYCRQMIKLMDAGLIVRGGELSYAYVNEHLARAALTAGCS